LRRQKDIHTVSPKIVSALPLHREQPRVQRQCKHGMSQSWRHYNTYTFRYQSQHVVQCTTLLGHGGIFPGGHLSLGKTYSPRMPLRKSSAKSEAVAPKQEPPPKPPTLIRCLPFPSYPTSVYGKCCVLEKCLYCSACLLFIPRHAGIVDIGLFPFLPTHSTVKPLICAVDVIE
jgi:hypothetical protein